MRDVTNYPLSPNWRKEVEDYMSTHNVTENEARYMLGYVPGDLPQFSITEAFDKVKEENPDVELSYQTMDFWVDEVMKRAIPKPNPKLLIKNLRHQLIYLTEIEKKRKLSDAEKADKRNLEILKKW